MGGNLFKIIVCLSCQSLPMVPAIMFLRLTTAPFVHWMWKPYEIKVHFQRHIHTYLPTSSFSACPLLLCPYDGSSPIT